MVGFEHIFFSFFKKYILFIHERQAETQAEGEAGSTQEPDVGLDPGPLGSHPEPEADAQALSHPGVPFLAFYYGKYKHRKK